jgi:hypothetical protein
MLFLISSGLTFFVINFGYNGTWELKKERDGIKVFTRSIDGSKYVEFKAEAIFKVPMQNFVDVLKNVGEYEEWVPDLKYSKLLESNEAHQIHYIITKLPFPLKDRDEIYKYTFHQINNKTVEVKMLALPDYLPREKDIVRIPESSGSYLFESISPSQTRVILKMHNDPGGNLPAWIVNSKVVKVPFGTLLALEKQASKK